MNPDSSQMNSNSSQSTVKVERVLSAKGDVMTVLASVALPPGSRVSLVLDSLLPTPLHLQGKITRIDRHDDTLFSMVVRVHSVTRDQRQILNSILP